MRAFWYIVIGIILLLGGYCIYAVVDVIANSEDASEKQKRKEFEKAYFEGQRDALEGDFRIRKLTPKTYIWIKSPWDDTTRPTQDTIRLSVTLTK